jgi:hypothetical protein
MRNCGAKISCAQLFVREWSFQPLQGPKLREGNFIVDESLIKKEKFENE